MKFLGNIIVPAGGSANNLNTAVPFDINEKFVSLIVSTPASATGFNVVVGDSVGLVSTPSEYLVAGSTLNEIVCPIQTPQETVVAIYGVSGGTCAVYGLYGPALVNAGGGGGGGGGGSTFSGTLTQNAPATATITGATVTLPPDSTTLVYVYVSLYGGSDLRSATFIIQSGFYMATAPAAVPVQVGATAYLVSQPGTSIATDTLPDFSVAANGIVNVTATYGALQTGTITWKVSGYLLVAA